MVHKSIFRYRLGVSAYFFVVYDIVMFSKRELGHNCSIPSNTNDNYFISYSFIYVN